MEKFGKENSVELVEILDEEPGQSNHMSSELQSHHFLRAKAPPGKKELWGQELLLCAKRNAKKRLHGFQPMLRREFPILIDSLVEAKTFIVDQVVFRLHRRLELFLENDLYIYSQKRR